MSLYYPIISYINEHISEKITLDELSQKFFVNKYYLSHRFKALFGITLGDYITQKRLSLAKSYLRKGTSVTLAGERAGFNSCNHFIRTFTKTVGVSPKQYSKQYLTINSYVAPSPPGRDAYSKVPRNEVLT